MNIIEQINAEQRAKLTAGRAIPDFRAGDTLVVNVKVKEGERTRVQAYEGVCIARGGAGLHQSFTVRKISYGEGVERVFPLFSPNIDSIKVERRGKVRRAKLYYLRDRRGKSARIEERRLVAGTKAAADHALASLIAKGGADDLALIVGVGPVYAQKLHGFGVMKFAQIAALDAAGVADLEAKLNIGEKIVHEKWVEQAKDLMASAEAADKAAKEKKAADKAAAAKKTGGKAKKPAAKK